MRPKYPAFDWILPIKSLNWLIELIELNIEILTAEI